MNEKEKHLFMTTYSKANGEALHGAESCNNLCSAMIVAGGRLATDLKKFEYEKVEVWEASKFHSPSKQEISAEDIERFKKLLAEQPMMLVSKQEGTEAVEIKAFIKKWNVGYESKEQKIEFAKEMESEITAINEQHASQYKSALEEREREIENLKCAVTADDVSVWIKKCGEYAAELSTLRAEKSQPIDVEGLKKTFWDVWINGDFNVNDAWDKLLPYLSKGTKIDDKKVREIASDTFKKYMGEYKDNPFAWHIYKRTFDIAAANLQSNNE